MSYQIWLGSETVDEVIDRITAQACAVAPALDRAACRDLVDIAFRTRVRQTNACGHAAACRPDGPMWDTGTRPSGETCAWVDSDPQSLPAMIGAALSDLVRSVGPRERRALEPELTMAVRGVFSRLLFRNRRCGHAAVCSKAEPTSPFVPLRVPRHGGC